MKARKIFENIYEISYYIEGNSSKYSSFIEAENYEDALSFLRQCKSYNNFKLVKEIKLKS